MAIAREKTLSLVYYLTLALIAALVAHQIYLYAAEPPAESAYPSQIEAIRARLESRTRYRFAVVGNINNSMRVFRDQIIPVLNRDQPAFVVSAGNAVAAGNEENYRALGKSLQHLSVPYVLTYGVNEDRDFGAYRFYQYYGPHFFSFATGNSHFLFLDNTGKTPVTWQLNWLRRELAASTSQYRFVFAGLPLHDRLPDTPVFEEDNYYENADARHELHDVFVEHHVDAVFSANLTLFSDTDIDGVRYVTTGGAGGAIVNSAKSFHHYVEVQLSDEGLSIEAIPLDVGVPGWQRTLDSIGAAVYAFFYVSYLRFLLLTSLLVAGAIKLRSLLFRDRDYYPAFDIDPSPFQKSPLHVLMMSNNYYPFVSGISVSIDRLVSGLRDAGHTLLLVVPQYADTCREKHPVLRVPSFITFGSKGEFQLVNLLHRGLFQTCRQFRPDIIHVHHPFWLGWLGLWFGSRLNVPVVYTYHTRIEHYSHYIPLPGKLFRNLVSHGLIQRFANRCDGVVVPTYSAEEYLRIIGVKSPAVVQPTGVDFARFQGVDEESLQRLQAAHAADGRKILVSVSRLGQEKNILFMLDALDCLKRQSTTAFRLLLVGDGPDRRRIEDEIERLGLEQDVTLTGAVAPERIATYYQLGDVFVFSSTSETQGMVILEAMSAGLPCVAIRASGIEDTVTEGITGFKTLEKPMQWADKVRLLLDDDELRAEMGSAARDYARTFDLADYARNMRDFYAETLARHHGAQE